MNFGASPGAIFGDVLLGGPPPGARPPGLGRWRDPAVGHAGHQPGGETGEICGGWGGGDQKPGKT